MDEAKKELSIAAVPTPQPYAAEPFKALFSLAEQERQALLVGVYLAAALALPLPLVIHDVPRPVQLHRRSLPQTRQQPVSLVRCELCNKHLNSAKPLSSLLNHAKRHYLLKQFSCAVCSYGSCEAAHVRNHMRLRHSLVDVEPIDSRNPRMQEAWILLTSRCFPTMEKQIGQFRFKNFKKRRQARRIVSG